ncbi:MAG: 50S ribosomal protein L35 [Streptosporangiales bacterium]|nr:50S ribosomal protein L35 [Streptosporangiales bacterium]
MPRKKKSHSGTTKRFRLTGTGKVMRRRANRSHYFEHKPATLKRRLANEVTVSRADANKVRKLLSH